MNYLLTNALLTEKKIMINRVLRIVEWISIVKGEQSKRINILFKSNTIIIVIICSYCTGFLLFSHCLLTTLPQILRMPIFRVFFLQEISEKWRGRRRPRPARARTKLPTIRQTIITTMQLSQDLSIASCSLLGKSYNLIRKNG